MIAAVIIVVGVVVELWSRKSLYIVAGITIAIAVTVVLVVIV